MRVEIISTQSYGHPNAAAFVRSTKVQIFRCDRHISDRNSGIGLGSCPHLKQFSLKSTRSHEIVKRRARGHSIAMR